MAREYVPVFFDWLDVTQDLTAEEKGNLIDAVVSYASGKEYEHLLTGGCKIAFRFLKGQVDRNNAISDKRSVAGSNKKEQTETNENKTEQSTTNSPKEKEKEKENKKREREQKTKLTEMFDRFYSAYPRREAKPKALNAFKKINPDEELLMKMLGAIERQKKTEQWTRDNGQFIPLPATWLNQRRWEDEVKTGTIRNLRTVPAQDYEQREYTQTQDEARNRMIEMMKEAGAL